MNAAAPQPLTARVDRPAWFLALARVYIRRTMRKNFDRVRVSGLAEATALVHQQPVVFAANHVAWWDPIVLLLLDDIMQTDGRCVMDAANFATFPFFGHVGAKPVDLSTAEGRKAFVPNALPYLQRPGDAYWVFAQGRQRPAHLRPLDFKPGALSLARKAGTPIVPVSLSYLWRNAPRPELLIRFGDAHLDPHAVTLQTLEDDVVAGLDAADQHIEHRHGDFEPLVIGGSSRVDRGLGTRVLASLESMRTWLRGGDA